MTTDREALKRRYSPQRIALAGLRTKEVPGDPEVLSLLAELEAVQGAYQEEANDRELIEAERDRLNGEVEQWRSLALRAWNHLDMVEPNAAITAELFAALDKPMEQE